jgi:hypothetical protein
MSKTKKILTPQFIVCYMRADGETHEVLTYDEEFYAKLHVRKMNNTPWQPFRYFYRRMHIVEEVAI